MLLLHPVWCHSVVSGNHLIPGEAVTWVCLSLRCIPVLLLGFWGLWGCRLLRLLRAAGLLFDLRVPILYTGDVPCNGAGDPLVVRPACRTLGLPRLAMAMASSSSAALRLAALRSSFIVCTVAGRAPGCISSISSVMREAPRWNSCSSWRLAMARMKGRTS